MPFSGACKYSILLSTGVGEAGSRASLRIGWDRSDLSLVVEYCPLFVGRESIVHIIIKAAWEGQWYWTTVDW